MTSTTTTTNTPPADELPELHRGDFVTITPDGACSGRDWRPLRRGCVLEVRTTHRFGNRSGEWLEIEGIEIGKRGNPLHDWMGCDKERSVYVNTASIGAVRRGPVVGDTIREPDGWYGRVARVYSDRETGQRMCRLYARPGETEGRRVRSWDLERIEVDQDQAASDEAAEQHQDGAPAHELPGYGTYGIGTEVAVVSAGWVEVDRGTPDNRGGDRREYRHTLTDAGRAALARAGVTVPPPATTAETGQPVDGAGD